MTDTKFEVDKDNLEVRLVRKFDCTPDRLWRAHTTPEQIVRWWANTEIDTFELKVGGRWRFVEREHDGDGQEHAFRGEFLELDEPHKIVRTFEYEPWAGHIMTETVTLEPTEDGKTLQTTISKYQNLEDLEGMVATGMESGATAGLERLAKVVEEK